MKSHNGYYPLQSNDKLTLLIQQKNISTWNQFLKYIQKLPYGRSENRSDFSLVLKEEKGTCSSKHALVKQIADSNNISVKLILGMYKMNRLNTPKIKGILNKYQIEYVPEAHCYLRFENQTIDLTFKNSSFKNIEKDIIEEQEITPNQVIDYKVNYHKNYVKQWLIKNEINYTFEKFWKIREECILKLSE